MKSYFNYGSLAFGAAYALALTAAQPASAACSFGLFPTVDPHASGNQLVGVGGAGANDLWEVGATFQARESRGYALHWNGSEWTVFHQSDDAHFGGQLSGVAEVAAHDIWAVGSQYAGAEYATPQAVIEHSDGRRFGVVAAPLPPNSISALYGLAVVAPSDVWAAGAAIVGSNPEQPLFEHWDGTAWSSIPGASVPTYPTAIDAIAASSTTDVWAVGGYVIDGAGDYQTLAEHWNGSQWSIVPTPNVNHNSNIFNAVVAVAPNDAWALGDYYNGRAFASLAEHWDGSKWSVVPSPNGGSQAIYVFGASGRATNAVWAAGEMVTSPGHVATFVMLWNGSAWSVVPSANQPNEPVTLLNTVGVLPDGSVWAAGGDADATKVIHTVTETYGCAAPERKEPLQPRR